MSTDQIPPPGALGDVLRLAMSRVAGRNEVRDAFIARHGEHCTRVRFSTDPTAPTTLLVDVVEGHEASVPARFGGMPVVVERAPDKAPTVSAHREALTRAKALRTMAGDADRMGIPDDDEIREVAFMDAPPPIASWRAVDEAMRWARSRRGGMVRVVIGTKGTGKTAAACHALLRAGKPGTFVTAHAVSLIPPTGWSDNNRQWALWSSIPLLVIDDLGVESQEVPFAELMLARYCAGLWTIVTSNLTRLQIEARYLSGGVGERLLDRLLNTQGRVTGEGEAARYGADGLPWCTAVTSKVSLRNREARARVMAMAAAR